MYVNGKNTVVKNNASTPDIIDALLKVIPIAINQCKEDIDSMIHKSGDPLVDAERCCRYIRSNVKYKADGFDKQNIQLPGRMFHNTKQADCKSFSLAFVGMMGALGHDCGFRFASYRKNKIPTHVYNFVVCNGKKYIFDACIENLKESPKHTYIQDMKVQYLSAPYYGFNYAEYVKQLASEGKTKAEIVKLIEEAKLKYEAIDAEAKASKPGIGKKILLAPVRGAFLLLVKFNARGLAHKLSLTLAKDPNTTKDFWKKLGGDFNTLSGNIDRGKTRPPFFGESKKTRGLKGVGFYPLDTEESYIGGGLSKEEIGLIAGAVAVAAPALVAVARLFKKNNVPEGEGDVITPDEAGASAPLPEGFEAADPETGTGTGTNLTMGFKPSPLMIGGIVGGLALVYFLMKKKK